MGIGGDTTTTVVYLFKLTHTTHYLYVGVRLIWSRGELQQSWHVLCLREVNRSGGYVTLQGHSSSLVNISVPLAFRLESHERFELQ